MDTTPFASLTGGPTTGRTGGRTTGRTAGPTTGRTGLTRRRLLGAAVAMGAVAPLGLADTAWSAPTPSGGGAPARLTLPVPTGPCPVGTVPLHLRDTSRPDPAAGPGRFRELMAAVWYPARSADAGAYPLAPWMSDGALRAFLADVGYPLDPSLAPLTSGHRGAPVHRTGHRLPVVVFSHGSGSHRADHTVICQELASHGYAVVTVDHTDDCFTEFPDGTVRTPSDSVPMYPRDYAADLRFLLDRVDDLAAGRNPDVDGRALPVGLLGGLDPDAVGAFGWSKGGTATALAMGADPRLRAGLALDGPMIANPAPGTDLDRPFMMMTAAWARATNPAAETFWSHLRGWRLDIQATGAVHASYGDNMTLIPQAGKLLGMTEQQIRSQVGTLDPDRGIRIQQAYPLAFFDLHLRHRGSGRRLLDGPTRSFPEVVFHP